MKKKNVINGYNFGTGACYHFLDNDKFKKITHQGYPVKNTFKSKNGRKYVVIERPKGMNGRTTTDYVVGNGYDTFNGTWAQGYYDFPTRKKAIYFAKKNAYRKY